MTQPGEKYVNRCHFAPVLFSAGYDLTLLSYKKMVKIVAIGSVLPNINSPKYVRDWGSATRPPLGKLTTLPTRKTPLPFHTLGVSILMYYCSSPNGLRSGFMIPEYFLILLRDLVHSAVHFVDEQ